MLFTTCIRVEHSFRTLLFPGKSFIARNLLATTLWAINPVKSTQVK